MTLHFDPTLWPYTLTLHSDPTLWPYTLTLHSDPYMMWGMTLLHLAARVGAVDVASSLVAAKADIRAINNQGRYTPLSDILHYPISVLLIIKANES